MEVTIIDDYSKDNFCAAEMKPTTPEMHDARSDASRHDQGELRKLNFHDGQGGCQRVPSSASSEAFLNESFYVEPYDSLPGDDKNPLISFKRTCEGMN